MYVLSGRPIFTAELARALLAVVKVTFQLMETANFWVCAPEKNN